MNNLKKAKLKPTNTIDKRLNDIEKELKKLSKEVDMTQKIVRLEVVSNTLRIKQDLSEEAHELHDIQLNKLDSIVKELENAREDRILAVAQTRQITEQANNHEERISKLETPQTS